MFNLKNPNSPGLSSDKDKMHPEDLRNLLVFFIVAGLLYFAYSTFVLEPQTQALKAKQEQTRLIEAGVIKGPEPEKFVESRSEALGRSLDRITFKNAEVSGSINMLGGRFDDLTLNNYYETLENKDHVSVLEPRGLKQFRTIDYGWIAGDSAIKVPSADTQWRVSGNAELSPGNPVTMIWDNGQGVIFQRTISIDEHYMFDITQSVINRSGKEIKLYPYGLVAQRGVPKTYQGTWVSYEGPVGYIGSELQQTGYTGLRKEGKKITNAQQGWIGITDKYWQAVIVPPQGEDSKFAFSFSGADKKDKENKGLYQADYMGAERLVPAGGKAEVKSLLYVGAKRVPLLQNYEKELSIPQFDLSVDFGWFWFMTKPFYWALHFLGGWIGNMGAAIIIMTICIRGAVFPLTNASYKSFAKMKKVGPMVAELRKEHGEDKQKLQTELVALYQREGVNPMSGCLPMILQIPIFFALYKTFFVTIELRHAPFFGWIQDLTAPDPTSIFNLFGLIPWDPPSMLLIGVWPCLMLVAMLIQKQLNPPPQDPIQRDMAMYMPFIFAYMMSHFASGLVVYWTFSAYIGVIQQIIIMKSLNVPIHLFGETKDEKELDALIEKGPAVHPLAEMVEDDVEDALFGDDDNAGKTVSKPKPKKSKKKK